MLCLFLFGLLWLLAMSFTTHGVMHGLRVQHQANSWPMAPARIDSSQLEETRDGSDIYFRPDVRFRFVAEGREIVGNRVMLAPLTGSRSWAEAQVRRHPAGSLAPVAYAPGDPGLCCLEPGISSGQLTFAMFLIPCDLVGCALLLFALRARRGRRLWGLRPEPQALGTWQGLNPDRVSPLVAACLALGVSSLLVQAPNALVFDMEPPWPILGGEAVFMTLSTLAAWATVRRRNGRLDRYVLIDAPGRRVRLPGQDWTSWDECTGVRVDTQVDDDEEDRGGRFWLALQSPEGARPWRSFGSRVEAIELGRWLAGQTGLPYQGPDED